MSDSPKPSPVTLHPPVADLALSERERDLIIQLRRIDFFRISRERTATVHWSGVRLRVFDAVQIR